MEISLIKLPYSMNAGKNWSSRKTKLFNILYKSLDIYPEGDFKKNPDLSFLSELKGLEELFLYHYKIVIDLKVLELCENLKYLEIGSIKSKSDVDLSGLQSLRNITIEDQKELASIYANKHVETITIYGYEANDLSKLKTMKSVKKIMIFNSKTLKSLKGIECLPSLKTIELSNCKSLIDISDYSNLDKKIKLRINDDLIYRQRDLEDGEIAIIKEKFGKNRIDIYWNKK